MTSPAPILTTPPEPIPAAPVVVLLPRPVRLVRHALPTLVESSFLPTAAFYLALRLFGLRVAVVVALALTSSAMLRRIAARRRVPGLLMLGVGVNVVRTVLTISTGSMRLYFLQPIADLLVVSGLFAVTGLTSKPLAGQLIGDFVPVPAALADKPVLRRYFRTVSWVWALAKALEGLGLFLLFTSTPLPVFLVTRQLLGWALTAIAAATSITCFHRMTRRDNVVLRMEPRRRTVPVPATVHSSAANRPAGSTASA